MKITISALAGFGSFQPCIIANAWLAFSIDVGGQSREYREPNLALDFNY